MYRTDVNLVKICFSVKYAAGKCFNPRRQFFRKMQRIGQSANK
jgi:hypothetical protein